MGEQYISFRCKNCQTEIQASPDMAGQAAECPACGEKLTIPTTPANDVVRHGMDDPDPDTIAAMKSRTIRIELGDL